MLSLLLAARYFLLFYVCCLQGNLYEDNKPVVKSELDGDFHGLPLGLVPSPISHKAEPRSWPEPKYSEPLPSPSPKKAHASSGKTYEEQLGLDHPSPLAPLSAAAALDTIDAIDTAERGAWEQGHKQK